MCSPQNQPQEKTTPKIDKARIVVIAASRSPDDLPVFVAKIAEEVEEVEEGLHSRIRA
jgi:hypothetical protein